MQNKPMKSGFKAKCNTFIIVGILLCIMGCRIGMPGQEVTQENGRRVAMYSQKAYKMAKYSGDTVNAYVHANIIAQGYWQANDDKNYDKWKAIEKKEAKNAALFLD